MLSLLIFENATEVFGGVVNGALRGIGRERPSLYIMLILFYLFFQPLSLYFAFHGFFLTGIWSVLILTTGIVSVANLLLLICADWSLALSRMHQRVLPSNDPEEPLLQQH